MRYCIIFFILYIIFSVKTAVLYGQRVTIDRVWVSDLKDQEDAELSPGDNGRIHVDYTIDSDKPETVFIGARIWGKRGKTGSWSPSLKIFRSTKTPGNYTARWDFTVNNEAMENTDCLATVGALLAGGGFTFDNARFSIISPEQLTLEQPPVAISPVSKLPATLYTIQIISTTSKEEAEGRIRDISYILPIPLRIEKIENNYIVKAGLSEKTEDLSPLLETIKENGYPKAFLRETVYLKEDIILEIKPSLEVVQKGQPKLLKLTRRPQIGTARVGLDEVKKEAEGEEGVKEMPTYKGEYYLGKAWQFYNDGNYKQAMEFFIFAESFPDTEMEVRLGKAHCYVRQDKAQDAIPLLEELVKKGYKLDDTLPNLIALLVDKGYYSTAYVYLDELKEGAEKERFKGIIEEALIRHEFERAIKGEDIDLLVRLTQIHQAESRKMPGLFYDTADMLSKKGRGKEAVGIYSDLLLVLTEDWDLRLGIFYSLKSLLPSTEVKTMVRYETLRPGLPLPYTQRLTGLRLDILKEELASLSPSSPMVLELAKEILAINPDDPSALIALGWWNFNNKEYEAAYMDFVAIYSNDPQNKDATQGLIYTLIELNRFDDALKIVEGLDWEKDPDMARLMLALYQRLGDEKASLSLAEFLAQSDDEMMQKVAGDFFYSQGWPITASQTYSDPDAYYYHADSPMGEFSPYFRSRSGEDGIVRFNEFVFPLSLNLPYKLGNEARFSLVVKHLSAGDAPSNPFVGKVFRGEQENDLITSLWVVSPLLEWKKEGDTSYAVELGTTPLNGPVYPLPTFLARLRQRWWNLNIHQLPVEQSILSYVGLEDPYGSTEWGRVLKSGVEGELTLTPFPTYWFSLKGGYDYYWGKDVWGNQGLHSSIAFGKTILTDYGNLSPSLTLSLDHFEHNTGFFTFGHAGYFSPDFFFVAGPGIRFQTRPEKPFWLDAQLSVGFMGFRLDSSPQFPFESGIDEQFPEDKFSSLNYNLQLQGESLISPHWSIGGLFSLNRSKDFTDFTIGFTVGISLEPRSIILPREYKITKARF